jgi:hypothetical protein
MDVTSNDVICNGGINPYHTPLPQDIITVPAGAQVTAEWHHTLNGADPSDAADPIGIFFSFLKITGSLLTKAQTPHTRDLSSFTCKTIAWKTPQTSNQHLVLAQK